MSQTTKRYIISSLITFFTGFALVMVTEIDNITLDTLKDGTIVSIVFVAVRAGLKAILEFFLQTSR